MSWWLKQKPARLIGTFKHLLSGASMWVTVAILGLSALSAWDTGTMAVIRDHLPWLSLPVFILLIVSGILVAMWAEYKWVQPGVMVYWNQLFYDHGNPMRKELEEIRRMVTELHSERSSNGTEKPGDERAVGAKGERRDSGQA